MITDNAIDTVLYALGLNTRIRQNIFYRWDGYYNKRKWDEIIYHEVFFYFPKTHKDKTIC